MDFFTSLILEKLRADAKSNFFQCTITDLWRIFGPKTICIRLVIPGSELNHSKTTYLHSHMQNSAKSVQVENIQDWHQKSLCHDLPSKQEPDLDAFRKEIALWNN